VGRRILGVLNPPTHPPSLPTGFLLLSGGWPPTSLAEQRTSPSMSREPLPRSVDDGREGYRRAGSAPSGLPVPRLTQATASGATVYLTTTVDTRGRLATRSPIRELGWKPGTSVSFRATDAAVIVVTRSGGVHSVTRQGHLRLPPTLRHRYRLVPGTRLFVVAISDHDLVEIYTPVAVEAMLESYRGTVREQPQW
jgi:bifunctional DNA-binding transcriptional regulator/antitoxin component of YhaV-PrlF toxin-antitoxin module